MQKPIQKFGQSSIVFEKPRMSLSKKIKLWRAPTTIWLYIFSRNFAHISYLQISTKGCLEVFLFCLDLRS